MADLDFFFDPVCPWAWVTSRWVVEVASQRDYEVDWRFICLRIVNEDKAFEQDPTSPYGRVHGAGRMMLRAAAAAKVSAGNDAVGRLYTEFGNRLHVEGRGVSEIREGNFALIDEAITAAGLGSDVATAVDDEKWDEVLREETAVALSRTGNDVGTPIITFAPGTERRDLVLRSRPQSHPTRRRGARDLGHGRALGPRPRPVRAEAHQPRAARLQLRRDR